jgi:hypothetical protein
MNDTNKLIGISIGGNGTIPLTFPSEEEFIRGVKSLERLTNIFIENVYRVNSVELDNFPEQVYLTFL